MIYIPPNSYFKHTILTSFWLITPNFYQHIHYFHPWLISPQILKASFISLSIIVMHFACIAHKFVSSKSLLRNASAASCSAKTVAGVRWKSYLISCKIFLTSWRNGSFHTSNSINIWNWQICLSATVPRQNQCSLFSPPVAGLPLFSISFVIKCFAAPSLFLIIVFFVLAIF